jgi:acrylyl-CoA reductase (NADPH)
VEDLGRFLGLVAEEAGTPARFIEIGEEDLGEGDVLIEIMRSSLNYKDGLAATATAPILRRYPSVIGIDLAGRVRSGGDSGLQPGDEVLVAGSGLGEEHPGGYTRFARVPSSWCVRLPTGLDAEGAMTLGTAGLTAMLACMALERNGNTPESLGELPVLVTGAAGGVGSIAIAVLSRLGYRVVALTGRSQESDYLQQLGADRVVPREALAAGRGPLSSAEYGAAIDVVGGSTLAELLRRIAPHGTVAACGLAGGADLSSTVYPFILRGVTLAGVNSVHPPGEAREAAWSRLAALLPGEVLDLLGRVEPLSKVPELAPEVLAGRIRGRVVLDVTA